MPEHKCEAILKREVIKSSRQRYVYDLNGRLHDMGVNIKEVTGLEKLTVNCSKCNLHEVFKAEGMGYVPNNITNRQARTFLKKKCIKWQEVVAEYNQHSKSSFTYSYPAPTEDSFFSH